MLVTPVGFFLGLLCRSVFGDCLPAQPDRLGVPGRRAGGLTRPAALCLPAPSSGHGQPPTARRASDGNARLRRRTPRRHWNLYGAANSIPAGTNSSTFAGGKYLAALWISEAARYLQPLPSSQGAVCRQRELARGDRCPRLSPTIRLPAFSLW